MESVQLEKIRLIGLKLQGKTTNQNSQSSKDCGNLWQRFEQENIKEQIPNKLSNKVYAVYYDYNGDENQPFAYFIGCAVSGDEVFQGLDSLIIPSQTYLKTVAKGVMPRCITETWKMIWSSKLPRRFGFDFETYDERSSDWNNAEVDIFVSVSK